MTRNMFFKIATDPEVDPSKCIVALSCVNQAIKDGHEVNVFFASLAVKLLQKEYINTLDERIGTPDGFCMELMGYAVVHAKGVYCSTGSQAAVGVTPDNSEGIFVEGLNLHWSGPPGVIQLAAASDVQMIY